MPKYSIRLKVYRAIKAELEAERMLFVCPFIMLVYRAHTHILAWIDVSTSSLQKSDKVCETQSDGVYINKFLICL